MRRVLSNSRLVFKPTAVRVKSRDKAVQWFTALSKLTLKKWGIKINNGVFCLTPPLQKDRSEQKYHNY